MTILALVIIFGHMKKEQIFSKTYAGQLLKRRKIEEVGTLVDHIANEGITSPNRIYTDFGIDFKTIKALRTCKHSVSYDTLGKFAYVIAFYLEQELLAAENIKYVIDKDKKLSEILRLIDNFKAIYGIEATATLELIKLHKDLREIVRTRNDNKP